MNHIKTTFDFDELVIPILGKNDSGLMIYGSADLEGDEDGFCVKTVYLADGTRIHNRGCGTLGFPAPFEEELFKRIAAVIENDKTVIGRHAATEWADAIERQKEAA